MVRSTYFLGVRQTGKWSRTRRPDVGEKLIFIVTILLSTDVLIVQEDLDVDADLYDPVDQYGAQ